MVLDVAPALNFKWGPGWHPNNGYSGEFRRWDPCQQGRKATPCTTPTPCDSMCKAQDLFLQTSGRVCPTPTTQTNNSHNGIVCCPSQKPYPDPVPPSLYPRPSHGVMRCEPPPLHPLRRAVAHPLRYPLWLKPLRWFACSRDRCETVSPCSLDEPCGGPRPNRAQLIANPKRPRKWNRPQKACRRSQPFAICWHLLIVRSRSEPLHTGC